MGKFAIFSSVTMATQLQLLVNMMAASFGTGILSMPWSAAGASVVPAVATIMLVAALMTLTMDILVRAGEHHGKYNLGSLLGTLPGMPGRVLPAAVNVCLWATLWLTLVGYVITVADAVQDFMDVQRAAIKILCSVLILPLCFLDMSKLSYVSSLSVFAVVNLFAVTSYTLAQEAHEGNRPHGICLWGLSDGLISMASISCTSMIIQMCALPMYEELDHRTCAKFNRVTLASFVMLFLIYAAYAVIGYFTFGESVHSNVLKDLPNGPWGRASRAIYLVVIMAAYPMFVYPMIASLKSSEALRRSGVNLKVICHGSTVVIVMSAMLAALSLDDLGVVNALVGALQCIVFVGLCPGLLGLHLLGSSANRAPPPALRRRPSLIALVVFCFLIGVAGLVYTDNYAQDLGRSCRWATAVGPAA